MKQRSGVVELAPRPLSSQLVPGQIRLVSESTPGSLIPLIPWKHPLHPRHARDETTVGSLLFQGHPSRRSGNGFPLLHELSGFDSREGRGFVVNIPIPAEVSVPATADSLGDPGERAIDACDKDKTCPRLGRAAVS